MKKIGLVIVLIIMLVTVANAASINGEFEGNPIINLKSNGNDLIVYDVPAILYNGRTMIPVYMLSQLGATVEWDQDTYSLNVELPKKETVAINSFDPTQKTKDIIANGGGGVTLVMIKGQITAITYFSYINGFESDWSKIADVLKTLTDFGTTYSSVVYVEGESKSTIEIKSQTYKDFLNGKITESQLSSAWVTYGPHFGDIPQSNSSIIPSYNSTDVTTPIDNTYLCQSIKDKYVLEILKYKRNHNVFSGGSQSGIKLIELNRDNELAANGCQISP
jgi:hypothetical protein